MRLREHEAVLSKNDQFMVDPRLLKVDPSYNVRDLDAPDERAALDELKEQIRASGVRTALEIRLQGQDVFIVAGHRRHKVVMELIAEGEPIQKIPATQEPAGTGEADRVANLVISNSGKPLTPLQVAEVVRRLVAFGWEKSQVAKRLGWKSTTSVNQYLDMLAMPEPVKEHVRKGEISATTARHLAKSDLTEQQQEELIRANLEENKRIIGTRKRSTKVTAKTIKRDQAKSTPAADVVVAQLPSAQVVEYEAVAGGAVAPSDNVTQYGMPPCTASIPADADARDFKSLADCQIREVPDKTIDDVRSYPAVQNLQRQALKELIDALLPFARIAEVDILDERSDDDLIECSVRDIKRAAAAWFKATGETTTTGNGEQSEAA